MRTILEQLQRVKWIAWVLAAVCASVSIPYAAYVPPLEDDSHE